MGSCCVPWYSRDPRNMGAMPIVVVLVLFAISLGAAIVMWGVQIAPVLAIREFVPRPIRVASALWEWFTTTLTDEAASEL